jgi:Protein of unknown function (DUF2806)
LEWRAAIPDFRLNGLAKPLGGWFGLTLELQGLVIMSDWLTLVKAIPGLAKAIAELIGDVSHLASAGAKVGTAKLGQVRQAIEDQTSRNSSISKAQTESEIEIAKAITKATVQHIGTHAAPIAERALAHGVHRLITEQHNREMVVLKAIENLRLDPPQNPTEDTPTEDWLNLFGGYAEKASSEKLREHWAYILAGEIRKPGSFSFITLQLAAVLDERLARTIEEIRPWILFNHAVPTLGPLHKGARYTELLTLAGIGFLAMGGHQIHLEPLPDSDDPIRLELEEPTILIPLRKQVKFGSAVFPKVPGPNLPVAMLTQAGKELLSVLAPVRQPPELPNVIIDYLMHQGFEGSTVEYKTK